jgi:hypothetical protein
LPEKFRSLILLVVFLLVHARSAGAVERHPSVALEIGACLDVEQAEVQRIVGIELRALMTNRESAAEPITRVGVDCYNPLVEIRVEDPVTRKALVRRIDLSTTERSVRARLLALAIAELVSSSWTELVSNPEPSVAPAGPAASEKERTAAKQVVQVQQEARQKPIAFGAGAHSRWFLRGLGPLLGGQVEVVPRLPIGILTLGATVDHGVSSTALGEVSATTASGGIGWRAHWSDSTWLLEAGAEGRLGAIWLSGTPRAPDQVAGSGGVAPTGGPVFVVRMGILPAERTVFTLGAELGYAVIGAAGRVEGVRAVRLDSAWVGVTLGLALIR